MNFSKTYYLQCCLSLKSIGYYISMYKNNVGCMQNKCISVPKWSTIRCFSLITWCFRHNVVIEYTFLKYIYRYLYIYLFIISFKRTKRLITNQNIKIDKIKSSKYAFSRNIIKYVKVNWLNWGIEFSIHFVL